MRSFVAKFASNPPKTILKLWEQHQRSFSSSANIRINDETKQKFIGLFDAQSPNLEQDYLAVSHQAGEILREIIHPKDQEILRRFGRDGRSVILLQNCPIVGEKGLPPTPKKPEELPPEDLLTIGKCFMLGIANLIGAEPYVLPEVRTGGVITHLIPSDIKSNAGSGSIIKFPLHNEVVHKKNPPDFFLLLCLVGNPMAKTTYCFVEDIIKFLPPEIISELEKPNFLMKSGDPAIFKNYEEHKCPILTKDQETGNYHIRLNTTPGRCEGLTDDAKLALNYINGCLKKVPVHEVALSRGDLLVIANDRTVHGRTSFSGERWVIRMNTRDISQNGGNSKL